MKIWIVQTGEPMFTDGLDVRPMRAMNLAAKLQQKGHKVAIITSNFNHITKTKRYANDEVVNISESLEIVFVSSPGYQSNISIARLWDHLILGLRIRKKLKNLFKPDVVFIGYPPIEVAYLVSKYCIKFEIPYLIDVKDAWPDKFLDSLPKKISIIAQMVFFPYFYMMKYSIRNATSLCSISNSFLNWAQTASKRVKTGRDFVAVLTSKELLSSPEDLLNIRNKFVETLKFDNNLKTAFFIGTLSKSTCDFSVIIEAARKGLFNVYIGGDGELLEELREATVGVPNIKLLGWLNQRESQLVAERSDFALAPIKNIPDFEMSIPNKFFDYLRLAKPILTSLNGDSRNLIEKNDLGFYFSNFSELKVIINKINNGEIDLVKIGNNCKNLYNSEFSFDKVYEEIVQQLKGIVVS